MNEPLEEGYRLAYGEERHGEEFFGFKVFVKFHRDFTKNDQHEISRAARKMIVELDFESARLDPKLPGWKAETTGNFKKAFEDAGLGPIFMEEIPNGYWPETDAYRLRSPWFIVTTRLGHFKVGWRKRVIVLDWERTTLRVPSKVEWRPEPTIPTGEELFPGEDVTRWETGIHCYGYEKMTAYLKVLAAL